MKKIIEIIKKKWLRDTFLTILLIAVIFAIYVGINYGVEKLNLEDIDFTADKIYSLTESSYTKLENIDKEVKIELLNLSTYTYLTDFISKYTQINSNIVVERIDDLISRPDIMSTYNMTSTDIAILITSGDRETILSLYDLYTYDYTTYEEIDITEEAITNGIIEVTIEDKPNIYFLDGHNYYDLTYFQLVQQKMESESNNVDSVNILIKGSIPDDCDCLVITTLKEDITEMEKNKIIEYINKGGKILLLHDANILGIETPNFSQVLDLYGFTISEGILMEQDENQMVYSSPEFIISQISSSSSIMKNLKMNMNLCVIDAGRIEFKKDELEGLGVTYEEIASVSDVAFLRKNLSITTYSKTSSDEDAANALIGALVTKTLEDGTTSEMIVYSNAIFATNQQVNMNNTKIYANNLFNNTDVVMNSVSYLTQRTDTITIRKDYESVTYAVTEQEHNIIMVIIFALPVLVIVIGIIVWQVRRRKK